LSLPGRVRTASAADSTTALTNQQCQRFEQRICRTANTATAVNAQDGFRSDIDLSCSGTMDAVSTTPPPVMARIDLRGAAFTAAPWRAALPRGGADVESVLPRVRPIVQAVAERGAEAALDFGASFDGVRPPAVRVPEAALGAALAGLDADVRDALQVMIE